MGDTSVPDSYWQALLRFAASVGADDPVNRTESTYGQLSEEDRRWLERAMAAFVKDTDPIALLKRYISELSKMDFNSSDQEEIDKSEAVLEDMTELSYNQDIANDFHKIGGYRLLLPMIASHRSIFRAGAANLIGVLAQNNPYSQTQLYESGILEVLLEMLDHDSSYSCRVKALFAIANIVRDSMAAERNFLDRGGHTHLLRALQSNDTKLQHKSCFLLQHLLLSRQHREAAIKAGLHHQLADLLASTSAQSRDLSSGALLLLVRNSPDVRKNLNDNPDFRSLITERLKAAEGDSALQDEANNILKIRKLLDGNVENEVDPSEHSECQAISSAPLALMGRPPEDPK